MIGAHTARALTDLGHAVVATAHRRTARPTFLPDDVIVERLDVTDPAAVSALGDQYPITDITHLAGSIPGEDRVAYFRADTAGLLTMLDAARAWRVRRFAVAGSLGSYLGRSEVPWYEDLALPTAPAPHPIIAFKKAVEPLTTNALQGTGIHAVVLRIGSTWGPLMDPATPFNAVPPYISAVLRGERPAPVYADDGGDFCYAPDAGRAIALLITADTLAHDVYNISGGQPFTNRQLVDAVHAAIPQAQLDLLDGRRAGPGRDPYLDVSRLATETGFTPAFDITTAVTDYVAWRTHHDR
ncbi:NAD(P)-dependent oxidoreductase [Micromonospora sp. STR1_7]|uniref:NAD(P)-dependent oxidoreductase n=2 Tax=Micromonospora parastrephiae TaxID=2806101 RepID=A0ABS1XU71_9ACTN|nr:NAD(P)-dependent oxidoreductase [Micromonospora parastrephiae]